ncbi:hypothetical protein [Streptomyces sp. NPDC127103]|uniref:hypothetical protein n=1 Tax=Streptomyces sp. NPDC127103 TaxID=3347139 RepID=UPI003665EDF6
MKQTPDTRAWFGAAVVLRHLAHATADDTPTTRARRGLQLPQPRGQAPVTLAVLVDTVTDVLHHADGWHSPEAVIVRAFHIHWAQELPREWSDAADAGQKPGAHLRMAGPAADPHELNAVAGAVADLFAAAVARFDEGAEAVADAAEVAFWEEAEAARVAAVRRARSTVR